MVAGHSDTLRFATAGSVDDGKSSLIGRLLFDSKSVFEDQFASIERASRARGSDRVELALLTDGLRAEREQNITIDVAYRYFATPKRKFIVADTPGHVQYTRNMVTGTSTADLSIILVDARKGVLSQSRRHAAISTLLGVPQLLVAVNKMDLVDYDEGIFADIVRDFRAVGAQLRSPPTTFIPISALLGDNVVEPSLNMPWYRGPTLLSSLESAPSGRAISTSFRFPVQYVVRPNQDFRGFAGTVESGSVEVGDSIFASSTGTEARVASIHVAGIESMSALSGEPAVLSLDREIDVSRGELLVSPTDLPLSADRLSATLCWMGDAPLEVGKRYLLLHGTKSVTAIVEAVTDRIDVDTLMRVSGGVLGPNDLGTVVVQTAGPIAVDRYRDNRATGSFVLVDPGSNGTVAAGMIQDVFAPQATGGTSIKVPITEDLPQDATVEESLRWAWKHFGTEVAIACSFGAEDMVLLDVAAKVAPKIPIFVLDTGRLHQESYDLMDRCRRKYGVEFEVHTPDTEALQNLIRRSGPNSFYNSVASRKECCGIRKVEPLRRALSGRRAWITGLRRTQSVTRSGLPLIESDEAHAGIFKLNPLASWSLDQVWEYIRANTVPYNALHDAGFPSIGCVPCTRAIKSGEDVRAGRWWWESPEHKECGLHTRTPSGGF